MNRLRYIQIVTALTVIFVCFAVVYMRRDTSNGNCEIKIVPIHQAAPKTSDAIVHRSLDAFPQSQEMNDDSLTDKWIASQLNTNGAQGLGELVEESVSELSNTQSEDIIETVSPRFPFPFRTGEYTRLLQEDVAAYGDIITNLFMCALGGDSQCAETLTSQYWSANCAAMFVADNAFTAAYRNDIEKVEQDYAMLTGHVSSLILTPRGIEAIPSIEETLAKYYLFHKNPKKAKLLADKLTRGRSGRLFLIVPEHTNAFSTFERVRCWFENKLEFYR